jgi:hypothetical protein
MSNPFSTLRSWRGWMYEGSETKDDVTFKSLENNRWSGSSSRKDRPGDMNRMDGPATQRGQRQKKQS